VALGIRAENEVSDFKFQSTTNTLFLIELSIKGDRLHQGVSEKMQANTGEPDIESQPNRASNLQEYVEGSSEPNPKVYSEGNGEYKHLKYFILFANENPAGEDYLDLLKRACHREIIYEAKSSDFGPALKVNLATLQRMVLCAIQEQLLDNVSAMTVSGDIIALDEVRLNRIKTLIAEYGRDASST
jgi:hypothetical protein